MSVQRIPELLPHYRQQADVIPIYLSPDNNFIYPTHSTAGDDMVGPTIKPVWTKRNIAQAETFITPTKIRGSYTNHGAMQLHFDAQGDNILQPIPAGDFEIIVGLKNISNYGMMGGIMVVDSAGSGIGFSPYNDGNNYTWNVTTYNYASTGTSLAGSPALNAAFWLSLKKVSSTYTGRISLDGVTWSNTVSISPGNTMDRIGVGRLFTTGADITVDITRFNVFPSPGFFVPINSLT